MANFTPSNLVKAQAILKARFNEAEMRKKQSAAVKVAMRNTDVLIPSYQELRKREEMIGYEGKYFSCSNQTQDYLSSRLPNIFRSQPYPD